MWFTMGPGGATWDRGEVPAQARKGGGEPDPAPAAPIRLPSVGDVEGPLFVGQYNHFLDDKRRVALPKPLRDEIRPERDGEGFFLVRGFDRCLWLYTERRYHEFVKRLGEMENRESVGVGFAKLRKFLREIYRTSQRLPLDKQGRIALPVEACRAVGIDREVVFIGFREKIELWSPAAEDVSEDPERIQDLAREIIG